MLIKRKKLFEYKLAKLELLAALKEIKLIESGKLKAKTLKEFITSLSRNQESNITTQAQRNQA